MKRNLTYAFLVLALSVNAQESQKEKAYIIEWCSAQEQVLSSFDRESADLKCRPGSNRQLMQQYLSPALFQTPADQANLANLQRALGQGDKAPLAGERFLSLEALEEERYLIKTEKGVILVRLAPFALRE